MDPGAASVGRFCASATLKLTVGLPVSVALLGPGVIAGFRDGSPPVIRDNLDAFLPSIAATMIAAALAGSVVSSADPIRRAPAEDQRRAARFVLALAALLGFAVYALVGWGLPLASQRGPFPDGISPEQALRAHPFLLTTPELLRVQEAFRGAGGFSRRVALTLELRAWLAVSMPVWGVMSVLAMLARRPASRMLRVLTMQAGVLVFWLAGLVLTFGPTVFLTPRASPQLLAWAALLAAAVLGAWRLWRRLRPLEAFVSISGSIAR